MRRIPSSPFGACEEVSPGAFRRVFRSEHWSQNRTLIIVFQTLNNVQNQSFFKLFQRIRGGSALYLAELEKDPRIIEFRSELFPTGSLLHWIQRRSCQDFTVMQDDAKNLILGLTHVSREVRQAKRDEWFRSLPPDRLSHEEVHLQEALNEFMEQWTNSRAPTTTEALQIHSIRAARSACLPRQISLANWIQHRLGHIWQIEEGGGIARKRGIDAVQ